MVEYKLIKIDKISYSDAFDLQKILESKVLLDESEQYILALSHDNVITTGKRGFLDNLKYSEEYYNNNNIELIKTDRGGLATFHGDGQLVLYFILNLMNLKLGVKEFVNKIEEAIIKTLKLYEINASKIENIRGVFVGNNKITAIGMHVKHNVTTHGIALNISTDLEMFDLFTPCGLIDKGVTSIKQELLGINNDEDLFSSRSFFNEVLEKLIGNISEVLGVEIERR